MAKKAKKSAHRRKKKAARRKKGSTGMPPVRAMSTHTLSLEIRDDGSLTKPRPVSCYKGDTIVWQVKNGFGSALEVALGGFKFRGGGILLKKPLKFLFDAVTIRPKETGEIEAAIVHNNRNDRKSDVLKYRIVVEDPASGDKDTYDPDLEVLPPPDVVTGGWKNPKGPRGGYR